MCQPDVRVRRTDQTERPVRGLAEDRNLDRCAVGAPGADHADNARVPRIRLGIGCTLRQVALRALRVRVVAGLVADCNPARLEAVPAEHETDRGLHPDRGLIERKAPDRKVRHDEDLRPVAARDDGGAERLRKRCDPSRCLRSGRDEPDQARRHGDQRQAPGHHQRDYGPRAMSWQRCASRR